MRPLLVRLFALLTLSAAVAACGAPTTSTAPTNAPAATQAAPTAPAAPTLAATNAPTTAAATAPTAVPTTGAAVGGYPVTVENCGRTLTFTKAPEKAFTGYQPVFELMAGLGLGDKIAFRLAWPESSLTPFLPEQKAIYDKAKEVSDSIDMPPREVAISLGADFLISEGYYNFNAESGKATIDEFAQNGTPVYIAGGWCSKDAQSNFTHETLYQDIRNLGKIFNIPGRAEQLVAEMQSSIADVAARVKGQPVVKVYAYDSGEGPLASYGGGMMQQTLSKAGGDNVFADQPWYFQANIESVAATAPDAFLIVDYPPTTAEEKFTFLCSKVVPNAPACTNKRYVAVPAVAFHPGYRNPFAVAEIAKVLHPDAFADAAASGGATTYPLTIENCGNTLTFQKVPERVVTLYPPTTEMLLRLGLKDRIVAAAFTEAEPVLPETEADYKALKSLSKTEGPPKEVLLNEQPDFVFDNEPTYFYDAAQGFATQDELRAAGAQVYTLSTNCGAPKPDLKVDDIYADIRTIGRIFNVSDRAEAVVAEMQGRIAAAQEKVKGQPPLKLLVYDSGEGPLSVFGANSPRFAVFKALGATSVFDEIKDGYGPVSAEEVAARDADVFIVLGYAFPGVATSEDRAAFLKKTFPNNSAVKSGRVYIFPYNYMNPSIQNAIGVEALARLLYPDAFK